MIRLAVSGACGKMGAKIIDLAAGDQDLKVIAALEGKGHAQIGNFIKEIKVSDSPDVIKDADCLIEFTNCQASIEHLDYLLKYKKAAVIGTTGFSPEQIEKIRETAKTVPILFSPNTSIGVNLLFKLVREASSKLSSNYKINIVEAHHRHKKDAPSGTAKHLAQIIKEAGGKEVGGIESIREGEIIGEHKVTFEGPWDTIELSHSAKTRDVFAQGALRAAKWVTGQKAGPLYSMADVLG